MNQDIIKQVRAIIKQELSSIIMGRITSNTSQTRTNARRFQTDGQINNLRNIQPWGLRSRAPNQTQCLIIPIGGDPTHLNVVGHFDESAPPINDGETVLYGANGQVIYMKSDGTIHQGSEAASEPVVLGNQALAFLGAVIDAFTTQGDTRIGYDSFGLEVFLDPSILQTLLNLKQQYITNAATNIVGQKNFVERGA
jgi:phage gp45-like